MDTHDISPILPNDWPRLLEYVTQRFQSRPCWKWLRDNPARTDVPVIAAQLIQAARDQMIGKAPDDGTE